MTYGTSFYKARVAHTGAPRDPAGPSPTTWAFLFSFDSIAIGDNAVATVKLVDGAVTAAKIADGPVSTAKMADASVSAAKMAADAVTTTKILDANVTTAKLADTSVTSAKLGAAAVTAAKIAAGAIVDTIIVPVGGETTTLTTRPAKRTIPYAFTLTAVRASLATVRCPVLRRSISTRAAHRSCRPS